MEEVSGESSFEIRSDKADCLEVFIANCTEGCLSSAQISEKQVFGISSILTDANGVEVLGRIFGKIAQIQKLAHNSPNELRQQVWRISARRERFWPSTDEWSVLSLARISPENNGKIWPQPDRENTFAKASGGSIARHCHPAILRILSHRYRLTTLNYNNKLNRPVISRCILSQLIALYMIGR